MKRATYFFAAINLVLVIAVAVACGQAGPRLFSSTEPPKPKEKALPSVKKVATDVEALEKWWNDSHGDGDSKLRIIEMKPRMKAKDFEIDVGGRLGPAQWVNCEQHLKEYIKERGKTEAHAFSVKWATTKSMSGETWLFVVADGEVIYFSRGWRLVR
jgi:hypothetical protein